MGLATGTKLGPYEIISPLGAGGMGEVYRARDTKLGRDVALKVLPAAVANDAARMARFQREAQVLASLNHPDIATIHGLEETGSTRALVMELVEGPTLADRIARGPINREDALPIAKQIAEALEYAHERGIIHRDLKPANIKVTSEGAVKILDFGLAKALDLTTSSSGVGAIQDSPLHFSPTLSIAATQGGVILGTAAYMSPEQAKGKSVDRRTDIWAFGCVLYEMLSGKKAFDGESTTDVLAAVVMKEPDWTALPANTPPAIRNLLRRCLQKDAKQRLRDIGEARIVIAEVVSGAAIEAATVGVAVVAPAPGWHRALPWAVAAALAVALATVLIFLPAGLRRAPYPVLRFTLPAPVWHKEAEPAGAVAISPDGTRVVYVSRVGNQPAGTSGGLAIVQPTELVVRSLDQAADVPLADTADAAAPFFSPDGRWVGFFSDGKLKRVSVNGGPAMVLCDAPNNAGASWGDDGFIYFAPGGLAEILRVREDGSNPTVVVQAGSGEHLANFRWPQILPGSSAMVFSSLGADYLARCYRIEAYSLKTGRRKELIDQGLNARYLTSGYLVFTRGDVLMAAAFDAKDLTISGLAIPLVEGVTADAWTGSADYAVSSIGTLLYLTGGMQTSYRLVRVDRHGAAEPLGKWQRGFEDLSVSPDGERVVTTIVENAGADVWIYDGTRDALTRVSGTGDCTDPLWWPDGRRVVYSCGGPKAGLFTAAVAGSGPAEPLLTAASAEADSFSPRGRELLYSVFSAAANEAALWVLPLEGDRQPKRLLRTIARVPDARFSPDGRWVAYVSAESDRQQVYAQAYPGPGMRVQVSSEGGNQPIWAPSGRELFFRSGAKLVAVDVKPGAELGIGKVHELFEGNYRLSHHDYDVLPDGHHFVMIQPIGDTQARPELQVVVNWSDEIRRLAPAGKR